MDALLNKIALSVTFLLEVFILVHLFKGRLRRRFFWFFLYIAYEILESALRFAVAGNAGLYLRVFWVTEVFDVLFMMLAVRESFLNAFKIYTRLKWFMWVIWGSIALGAMYALLEAVVFPPVEARRSTVIIIDLEVAVTITILFVCGLHIFFYKVFDMKGNDWELGVIYGFTAYVWLASSDFLLRSMYGAKFPLLTEWLAPLGYILAEIIWIWQLTRPEPPVSKRPRKPTLDDLLLMNQYMKALERFLRGR